MNIYQHFNRHIEQIHHSKIDASTGKLIQSKNSTSSSRFRIPSIFRLLLINPTNHESHFAKYLLVPLKSGKYICQNDIICNIFRIRMQMKFDLTALILSFFIAQFSQIFANNRRFICTFE